MFHVRPAFSATGRRTAFAPKAPNGFRIVTGPLERLAAAVLSAVARPRGGSGSPRDDR